MPKISVSVAKSLLEEAGVKPEEASAMVKELIVRWANFRGRMAGRRKIIKALRDRVMQKISEVRDSVISGKGGSLDYIECVRRGILTKLLSALEDADFLLEVLKDAEIDEIRKAQISLQQDYIKFIRERIERLHQLSIDLAVGRPKKSGQDYTESVLTDTVIDTTFAVLMAISTALYIEKFLLESENIAKETEEELMKTLRILEKYLESKSENKPSQNMTL